MASFRPLKINGTWYIRCRAPNKREIRFKIPSAKNKAKAERLAEEMQTRFSLGLDDPWERKDREQEPSDITLKELVQLYMKRNKNKWSKHTTNNKEARYGILQEQLNPSLPISRITYQHVNKAINNLKIRATSKKSYLREWKALFNWSNKEGFSEVNTQKVELDRQPTQKLTGYIEPEDLKAIIQTYLEGGGKQIYADVWHFTFYNGPRRDEIPSILKEHVDLKNRYVQIGSDEFLTKHNMENRIPIAPENLELVERYYEMTKAKKPLFPINAKQASVWFTKAAKQTFPGRRKRWGIHLLRHSCGMYLMNHRGWHEEEVQEFLRHTSSQTVKQYRHGAPAKLRNKLYGNNMV